MSERDPFVYESDDGEFVVYSGREGWGSTLFYWVIPTDVANRIKNMDWEHISTSGSMDLEEFPKFRTKAEALAVANGEASEVLVRVIDDLLDTIESHYDAAIESDPEAVREIIRVIRRADKRLISFT